MTFKGLASYIMLHSLDQSKSQGKPVFMGWRIQFHLFMEKAAKSMH
jgi:hypothetical protein